ncbi:MAG: hypothetical protein AAB658_01780 [Chloroflexota bacterium]
MPVKKLRPGKRFRLRLYERLFAMLRWPAFLLAVSAYVLWWIAPDYPILSTGRDFLLIIVVLSGALWVAGLIAPALCYVQCRADYLLISTPVYRLSISYSRIGSVTAVNFGQKYPFHRQKWSQRRFLEPLFLEQKTGQLTVVAVWVKQYPLPLRWLRLWLTDYMFAPDAPGFLLMVSDWMALSRQIDDYRDAWRERRYGKKMREASAAIRILTKGDKRR